MLGRETVAALTLAAALAGCSAPPRVAAPRDELDEVGRPQERRQVGARSAPPESSPRRQRLPAWEVLERGTAAPSGLGAYGYVVLTSLAPATRGRHERLCEDVLGQMPAAREVRATSRDQLVVTFWPVTVAVTPPRCAAMVADYDLELGTRLAAAVGRLGASGPVLVAWRNAFGSPDPGESIVFDLSLFSDDDLGRAVLTWRASIARDPEHWHPRFDLDRIRDSLREFVDAYGESVIALVRGE